MASTQNLRIAKREVTALLLLWLLPLAVSQVAGAHQARATPAEERDRGIQLYKQGDFKGAIKLLRDAAKKNKEDGEAWYFLGMALLRNKDSKNARKALERAVTLRPDLVPAHTALSNLLLLINRVGEAEDEARRALSFEPENPEANYLIGVMRLRKRSCLEAAERAETAVKSAPSFGLAYLLRSQSRLCSIASGSSGPYAVGSVSRTGVGPGQFSHEEQLANARRTAERFRQTADDLEKFLQLEPGADDASMWRQQLEEMRIYSQPAEKVGTDRSVFNGAEVTTKARIIAKPEPSYTESARKAQVVGTVVLRAVLALDGSVQHILVLGGLPQGLTEQAIKAAVRIKFVPAMIGDRAVSVMVQLEYNFNLY